MKSKPAQYPSHPKSWKLMVQQPWSRTVSEDSTASLFSPLSDICMFGHFLSLLERPNGRTFLDTAILGIALFLHFILLAIDYVAFFEIEMPPGEFEERWRNLWNPEADSSHFD